MKKAFILPTLALIAGACAAPTSSADIAGDDLGTGGVAPVAGGVVPGAAVGGSPGTGGVASAAGGTASAAGGTASAAGGTTAGAGGGATAGPPTCNGTAWAPLNGFADNGTMCGFAWTGVNGEGETISPACGDATCFTGETICASGTIPAENVVAETYPGIMIGWNVSQAGTGGTAYTWTSTGTGITVNYADGGAAGTIRVVIQSNGTDYCFDSTSGVAIPWSSFKVGCWDNATAGPAFTVGSPVTAIAIQINSTDSLQTFTDFCLNGVTLN